MSTASLNSVDRPTGDALSLPAVNDGASRAILVKFIVSTSGVTT